MDDIKYALNPTYKKSQIEQLDKNTETVRAQDGYSYLPGIVGFNNINQMSPINAILQSLVRIPKLRDFFIQPDNYSKVR